MRTPVHIDYANTHGTSKQSASTHEQFSINKSHFPNNQHTLSPRSPTETDYTHDQANNSIPKSANLASPTNMKMFPLHAQEVESDSGNSKSSYSANAPGCIVSSSSRQRQPLFRYLSRKRFIISALHSAQPEHGHDSSLCVIHFPISVRLSCTYKPNHTTHQWSWFHHSFPSMSLYTICCSSERFQSFFASYPHISQRFYGSSTHVTGNRASSHDAWSGGTCSHFIFPGTGERGDPNGLWYFRIPSGRWGWSMELISRSDGCKCFCVSHSVKRRWWMLRELFLPFGTILSTKVVLAVMIHVSGVYRYSNATESRVWIC